MLKGDAAVPKMDSVPLNTSAYHFSSESDGWAASEASFSTPQMAEKTGTRSAVRLRAQFLDCFSLVSRREFFWEAAKRTPAS